MDKTNLHPLQICRASTTFMTLQNTLITKILWSFGHHPIQLIKICQSWSILIPTMLAMQRQEPTLRMSMWRRRSLTKIVITYEKNASSFKMKAKNVLLEKDKGLRRCFWPVDIFLIQTYVRIGIWNAPIYSNKQKLITIQLPGVIVILILPI